MAATDDMLRLILGFRPAQAVHVAAELGIADRLAAGPVNVAALAEQVGADPDGLRRLMRALAAMGVFHEVGGEVYETNELGQTLETGHPDQVQAVASNSCSPYFWDAWGRLEHSVRTGENAFRSMHGMSVWEYRAAHPEASARFDAAMRALTLRIARGLVAAYDFSAVGTVVDVGGGHGGLLAEILHANPDAVGVLYDLPHVIATAGPAQAARGVAERVRLEGGSFFDGVPDGGDCYLLKSVLHDWEDDDCVRILGACAPALASGAVLLVVERLMGDPATDRETTMSDLNMMVLPGGRERTAEEFDALVSAAGLRVGRTVPAAGAFHAIEVVTT
jgi:hypothetical protein